MKTEAVDEGSTTGGTPSGDGRPRPDVITRPAAGAARWWVRLLLGALLVALFTVALGQVPLIDPDEGRYARVPQEMLQTGDLVTPRLDGVRYFEKPPLYYWLNAAALEVLGEGDAAPRVWSSVLGLGGLLLGFALARSVAGERAGLLAALVLGTSILYVAGSHFANIDPTVSFFIAGALTSFWFAHRGAGRRSLWLWLATAAASALAVMAKGLIGIVIPGGVILLYLGATRQLRLLARVPWVPGGLLFAALTVPWFVLVWIRNPGFGWFFFVHEHLLRYTTDVAERGEPWWFFAVVAGVGMLPWTGAILASVGLLRRPDRSTSSADVLLAKLLWIWALVVIVFFSLSHSKLASYIVPALPPLGVLGALAVDRSFDPGARVLRRFTATGLALGTLATAAVAGGLCRLLATGIRHFPFADALRSWDLMLAAAAFAAAVAATWLVARGRLAPGLGAVTAVAVITWALLLHTATAAAGAVSMKPVATALTEAGARPGEVFTYYSFPHSLAYYLGYDLGVVGFHGELGYGISHAPASLRRNRFPSFAEFRQRWRSGQVTYVVVPRRELDSFRAQGLAMGSVVYDGERMLAMTNR